MLAAIPRMIALVLSLWAMRAPVWSAPEMVFHPNPLRFGSVAVGDSARAVLVIRNAGDATMVVQRGGPVLGMASAFEVEIGAFELEPGDSLSVDAVFAPVMGGDVVDALVFESNANPEDPTRPRPILQLSGSGRGAEIAVAPGALTFASPGIGASTSQFLSVSNSGNDSLRITQVSSRLSQFVADAAAFVVGPNETRTLTVAYTPDSSLARLDTLLLISNDFDEDTTRVPLDAQETPLRVGDARVDLIRQDTLGFPSVGDTLSILLLLRPNGASVGGIDAFFGYDPNFFAPVAREAPFIRAGLTLSRLQVRINALVSQTASRDVVHLSALVKSLQDSIVTDNAIAQIDLVVLAPLNETTQLRMLVESPLFNSQYITPSGLSFTAPGETRLVLGNSPPVLKPFPLLEMREDEPANLGLVSLATDAESPPNELAWAFSDPDGLVVVSVSVPDSIVGPVARFFPPPNASGTYSIKARVTDPAGASDSSVVVVSVAPVNDPPRVPRVLAPADSATDVASPVTLRWRGGDPDLADAPRYEIRFGQNPLFLSVIAKDLEDTVFVPSGALGADAVYFWQVETHDAEGLEIIGPVWQFRTAADASPPAFVAGPELLAVTDSTAALFWSLSEPALARIVLGLEPDLSDSLDFAPVLSPRLQLRNEEIAGLAPGTQYYFRVTLTDGNGNQTQSDILGLQTSGVPPADDPGDMNADRRVDFDDFLIFANSYGLLLGDVRYVSKADMNADGEVAFVDFILFSEVYGTDYALGKPTGKSR